MESTCFWHPKKSRTKWFAPANTTEVCNCDLPGGKVSLCRRNNDFRATPFQCRKYCQSCVFILHTPWGVILPTAEKSLNKCISWAKASFQCLAGYPFPMWILLPRFPLASLRKDQKHSDWSCHKQALHTSAGRTGSLRQLVRIHRAPSLYQEEQARQLSALKPFNSCCGKSSQRIRVHISQCVISICTCYRSLSCELLQRPQLSEFTVVSPAGLRIYPSQEALVKPALILYLLCRKERERWYTGCWSGATQNH